MKFIASVFAAIVIIGGVLTLGWVLTGNELAMTSFFSPKFEQVRNDTFKNSQAYNDGIATELQNMQFEYIKASPEHQAALASIILHRAGAYDTNRLPLDLRLFVNGLKNSATTGSVAPEKTFK
jgi:hypothetical protein